MYLLINYYKPTICSGNLQYGYIININGGQTVSKKKNKVSKQRNAIQQIHIEQNRKAGAHKDKKKEQNRKA